MADNALAYPKEIVQIAKRTGVHPGEVEICADCGLMAPPMHPGCGARLGGGLRMWAGYFSPNGSTGPKKGERFSWRARGRGWRVRLDCQVDWRWSFVPLMLTVSVQDKRRPDLTATSNWMRTSSAFDVYAWAPLVFGSGPEMVHDVDRIWFQAVGEVKQVRELGQASPPNSLDREGT